MINTLVGNRFKDSGDISFLIKLSQIRIMHTKSILLYLMTYVPDKLEIKDMDKVFANIFKTWNSDRFFEVIQRFELPTNAQIKTFSRGMRMKQP